LVDITKGHFKSTRSKRGLSYDFATRVRTLNIQQALVLNVCLTGSVKIELFVQEIPEHNRTNNLLIYAFEHCFVAAQNLHRSFNSEKHFYVLDYTVLTFPTGL
jgi:hypothetical protein